MAVDISNKPIKKQQDFLWLHGLVTLALMFGFGYLPPINGITPIGMKYLGVFIGLIYAWSTTSLIWPSLLGFLAIGLVSPLSMKEFIAMSMGNDLAVMVMIFCIFIAAIEEAGLMLFIANWFISRKITYGRPWLFTIIFLFGAYVGGIALDFIAPILVFWGIFYSIAKQVGLKPFDKYSTLMIFGVAWAAIFGSSFFPFKGGPLLFFRSYYSVSGIEVNAMHYMLYSAVVGVLSILLFVFLCKYVFKADVSCLKNIDDRFVNQEALVFDKKKKVALGLFVLMMVMLIAPYVLPRSWFFVDILAQLDLTGVGILMLIILFFIKIDGQPFFNFRRAAQGIAWDMVFLFAIVLPLGNLLVGKDTGISAFLTNMMQPLVTAFSPMIAIIMILIATTIITNFALNIVVAILAIPLIAGIAQTAGIDATPFIMALCYTVILAFVTPAASTPAAMVFGNTEWVRPKDMYKYGTVTILCTLALVILLSIPMFIL